MNLPQPYLSQREEIFTGWIYRHESDQRNATVGMLFLRGDTPMSQVRGRKNRMSRILEAMKNLAG